MNVDIERLPAWLPVDRSKQRLHRKILAVVGLVFTLILFRSIVYARPTIQHTFVRGTPEASAQPGRLRAVREEFLHAWHGYKKHAWKADSLLPLTGKPKNDFCGWSATMIDSLDTLWMMDLKDEFNEALDATLTIDFLASADNCSVNTFESTIRYVGGLLAAYDLSGDVRIIGKLEELGHLLHLAFDSANGMPCSHCSLGANRVSSVTAPSHDAPLADLASFYLEFARLSQVTGDVRYMDTMRFLTETFQSAQSASSVPGLWPERLDASSLAGPNARFATRFSVYSLGALSDSAYEYLVKAHLLLGGATKQYKAMWERAVSQIRQFMLFHAIIPPWNGTGDVLFSGVITRHGNDPTLYLETRTQHLACFAGGMFALASKIFNVPSDLKIGEALTNGCVWAYDSSPTGIMPETFSLLACPDIEVPCAWNRTAWCEAKLGGPAYFSEESCEMSEMNELFPPGYVNSIDTHYGLRPEAIESVFIMYRVTGDPHWREVGWRMFSNIIKHTRTPYGHASLMSSLYLFNMTMTDEDGNQYVTKAPMKSDEMQSFWLAETLKYFWLLFSDPDLISLDDFVLNTEAHPLRLTNTRGFP